MRPQSPDRTSSALRVHAPLSFSASGARLAFRPHGPAAAGVQQTVPLPASPPTILLIRVENMSKRRGDYSASSNEEQKANKSPFRIRLESPSGAWPCKEVLLKLSPCVVGLSFIGNQEHYQYTGLVIKSNSCVTCILTSATAIRSSQSDRMINFNVSIHVNLPNGQTKRGSLRKIDYAHNIAIISMGPFPDFQEASLDQPSVVGVNDNVVALCHSGTGEMMVIPGVVTERSYELFGQRLIASTCDVPEFGVGGPLVNSEGHFVGMNMCPGKEALFLPKKTIIELLVLRIPPRPSIKQGSDSQIEGSTSKICKSSAPVLNSEGTSPVAQEKGRGCEESPNTIQKSSVSSTTDSETESSQDTDELLGSPESPLPDNEFTNALTKDLLSRGYPLPKMLDGGMELRKNFEEEFAGDIWNRLTEKVSLDTSLSVVSLASFRGETRLFACTGVLIGCHKSITRILTSASLVRVPNKNEIDGSLKIQVLLPDDKYATGKLQHHNLNYNIAVVSIEGFHSCQMAKLYTEEPVVPPNEVVAIGRTFETGKLMATSGVLTDNSSNLISEEHGISTCKITKAGIGGLLIDFCGNFIGMNFYDVKRTPYLPRHIILEQLKDFDRKGSAAKVNKDSDPNRWYVPEPRWYYPSLAPPRNWDRRKKH